MILQLRRTFAQIKFVVRRRSGAYRIALLAALACACALHCQPVAAQATFTPIGLFGAAYSRATEISADGSVIVGTAVGVSGSTVSVFRMTSQGVIVRSTGLASTDYFGGPSVSADGSTVVGAFLSSRGEEAFRWVGDGPFEGLGDLPGGDFQSSAADVSADGSVVVGASRSAARSEAFRWTAGDGMAALGGEARTARAVSADGSVVVGSLWSGNNAIGSAYRWTMQTGTTELPRITRESFFWAARRQRSPQTVR
jgi:probable HAF family extracellular repeat protein